MPAETLQLAREALRAGDPAALLGVREGPWLDAKGGIYELGAPSGAEELAKDVAAFANTKHGGLLVIGIGTLPDAHGEVLDRLKPIALNLVDLDRHRKVIRERVTPSPRNVCVAWIDLGNGRGVLYIDIPEQPRSNQPHVVAAPAGRDGKSHQASIAVPIREADGTYWLPRAEVHQLLAAGWAQSGGPSREGLVALVAHLVQSQQPIILPPPAAPAHEVGGGEPTWTLTFQEAHQQMRRQLKTSFEPVTDVYQDGPGVVQAFSGGYVLCALPNQLPVAVSAEIWRVLHDVASKAQGIDAMSAIGYPNPSSRQRGELPVFNDNSRSIGLIGGAWGTGQLARESRYEGPWSWEPELTHSFEMTGSAQNWTAGPDIPQLRLRAVATLPWADASSLKITTQRRRELVEALSSSALLSAVTALTQRHGDVLRPTEWTPGPNLNALDSLSYSSRVLAPDGRVVLTIEVMLALPNRAQSAVVACAEVRFNDVGAWNAAIADLGGAGPTGVLPLELVEIGDLFAAAWHTAAEQLPGLTLPDRANALWTAVPAVELRVTAEDQANSPGPHPALADYIDFRPFGQTDRDRLDHMAVTATAPAIMPIEVRTGWTHVTLVHMCQGFGYVDATVKPFAKYWRETF
ncbi:MAG TPA: ATP-binding protein [Actinocrinis sp.]|nr:ATP-binding protein [Actinocrinis sp.]